MGRIFDFILALATDNHVIARGAPENTIAWFTISFLTTALTFGKIHETVDKGQRTREELDRALEENRELKRFLQAGVGSGGTQERGEEATGK